MRGGVSKPSTSTPTSPLESRGNGPRKLPYGSVAAARLAWYAKRLSFRDLNGLSGHRPPAEDRLPHACGAERARAGAGEGVGGRGGLRKAPGEEREGGEVRLPRRP